MIDVPHDSIGHLFYLDQNAIVVASKPHVVEKRVVGKYQTVGSKIPAESFIDVLERLSKALHDIEKEEFVRSLKAPKVTTDECVATTK